MMFATSTWFRLSILLAPLSLACGGRHTTDNGGGETNWLRACTTVADCPSGDCVCGSCTLACSDSASCSAGPPGTTCAVTGSSALAAMCGASPLPAGACLPPCAGGCASATVCVADHCVPVREPATTDAGDADARAISCPPGVAGHCSAGAKYPTYPGFALALVEDFDEPIDLVNDSNWTYSDGFGEGNYTRFKKEAISFAGGNLIITAAAPTGGVVNADYPTFSEGTQANYPATVAGTAPVLSGEFRSKHNDWRYGRFEVRMAVPATSRAGNFINAFFTFRTPKWQNWRELDFEITPANSASSVGTNLIWDENATSYVPTASSYGTSLLTTLPDGGTIYDDFHTYAFEALPARVTWYVDGAAIRTETGTGVKLPERSMKIMLNLWVFPSASWGGGLPVNNAYPMQSTIDWIRLYKSDAETTYPCRPTPACLPVEDRDYSKNNAEDGVPAAAPW
jgi:beta-glucanase (GH16 family)